MMNIHSIYEIYILNGYSESILKCDFKHKKATARVALF